MMKKYCSRQVVRRGVALVVIFLTYVGAVEAQTWFHKKIWFTRQDSVPVYNEKRVGADTVDFIKPWTDLNLRADHNNEWVVTETRNGRPQTYIPVSKLGYYLSGNRNYEIVSDSVVGRMEVHNPAAQGVPPRSTRVVMYKGNVVRLNRVYEDCYVYHFKPTSSLPAIEVKLPKEGVAVTEAKPNGVFSVPEDFKKLVQEDYQASRVAAPDEGVSVWLDDPGALAFRILLVIVTIACLVGFYFIHGVWFERMYRDRSKSNASISMMSIAGGGALMFVAGNCLWFLTSGFTALLVAGGCLLVYVLGFARAEYRLDSRCRKCANYKDVSYLGVTKDGTKWEYDHVHDYYVRRYWDGDKLIEKRVNRNEWLKHLYQMHAFNYRCEECGYTWKVRYKGELIASGKRVEQETEKSEIV